MWTTVLETSGYDFEPEQHWANGCLKMFKATNTAPHNKWAELKACIDCAVVRELRAKTCPVEFLDEIGRVAMQKCATNQDDEMPPELDLPAFQTFLDFAVWFDLTSYVRARAPSMTYAEVSHATKFRGLQLMDPRSKMLTRPSVHVEFLQSMGKTMIENAVDQKYKNFLPVARTIGDSFKTGQALEHVIRTHFHQEAQRDRQMQEEQDALQKLQNKAKRGKKLSRWRRVRERVFG